jgi:hypothetical protein
MPVSVSSPLRSVALATMNSISNSSNETTTERAPHRTPLIQKLPTDKQHINTSAYAASTENPSSAKRPKVNNDDATTAAATPVTVLPLVYPTTVLVPSREIVQSLFEEAIQSNDTDDNNNRTQQAQAMANAGLLSFTDVLLPAAAYCEEQALKQLQAVVQRDHSVESGSIDTVKLCRKAVYDGVSAAMRAAVESRANRELLDEQRQAAWKADAAAKAAAERDSTAALQQQEDECRALELSRQKADLKKKLPRNQELWREVAYLMTEISKMQKEERLWQQAEQNLALAEQELDRQEQEQQMKFDQEQTDAKDETTKTTPAPEIAMVEQTIEDITLSSIRIQQALKIVSGIITESDQVRKDLYRRYRKDHQFHGYPGIKNTKGLLKVLSQSQDF